MCYNLLMETGTNLEQQITEMEQALAAKRAQLEGQQTAGEISALPSEKETLHEVVGEKITELAPAGSGPAQSGAGPLPGVSVAPADPPAYLSPELKDKVQALVSVAFSKSLAEAVQLLAEENNPALNDAFHDVLTDQFYEELLKQGKLKPI